MTRRPQGYFLSRNRNARWQKRLRQLAQMREAKARKRLLNPPDHEPAMRRTTCLSLGFRDELNGHVEWVELKSARQAHRLAGVLLKEYTPGGPV